MCFQPGGYPAGVAVLCLPGSCRRPRWRRQSCGGPESRGTTGACAPPPAGRAACTRLRAGQRTRAGGAGTAGSMAAGRSTQAARASGFGIACHPVCMPACVCTTNPQPVRAPPAAPKNCLLALGQPTPPGSRRPSGPAPSSPSKKAQVSMSWSFWARSRTHGAVSRMQPASTLSREPSSEGSGAGGAGTRGHRARSAHGRGGALRRERCCRRTRERRQQQ